MLVPEGTRPHGFHHYTTPRPVQLVVDLQRDTVAIALVALPAPAKRPDAPQLAPYVPTPQDVVDRMLKLARVGKNDVVLDLGCGDGRIPITAARTYGARGIGVDIDYPIHRYFLWSKALELSFGNATQQLVTLGRHMAQNVPTP